MCFLGEAKDLGAGTGYCSVVYALQGVSDLSIVSSFLAYFIPSIFVRITSAVRIYLKKHIFFSIECYLPENDLHLTVQFPCMLSLIF
jgi:hypothetical protein